MKNVVFVAALLVMSLTINAQDVFFSQFTASPLHLNPSLTGDCDGSRLVFNYRNQWPGVGGFQTMNFSFDQNFKEAKSGVGVQVMAYIPSKILNYYYAKVYYAYNLQVAEKMFVRAGIGGGVSINDFNSGEVVLPDFYVDGPTEIVGDSTVVHADFSIGMSFNYAEKYFGGISADHVSLLTDIPVKFSAYFGMNVDLNSGDYVLSPYLLYQNQGGYDVLSVTAMMRMNAFKLGLSYNVNIMKFSMKNIHSLSLLCGLSFSGCDVCYSYDAAFGAVGVKTRGAHEISVVYCFGGNVKKKY